MIPLILVIGTLLLMAFLLSRREIFTAVTSTISAGDFCPDGYIPITIGIAPEWKGFDVGKIKFFIDPTTGCLFEKRGVTTPTVIILSDRAQISRFISLNGLPTQQQPSDNIFQTPKLSEQIIGPALQDTKGNFTCPINFKPVVRGGIVVCASE